MADAAVFEIFVYKNGEINTCMLINGSPLLLPIHHDKERATL